MPTQRAKWMALSGTLLGGAALYWLGYDHEPAASIVALISVTLGCLFFYIDGWLDGRHA